MPILTPYKDDIFEGTHKGFIFLVWHVERKGHDIHQYIEVYFDEFLIDAWNYTDIIVKATIDNWLRRHHIHLLNDASMV